MRVIISLRLSFYYPSRVSLSGLTCQSTKRYILEIDAFRNAVDPLHPITSYINTFQDFFFAQKYLVWFVWSASVDSRCPCDTSNCVKSTGNRLSLPCQLPLKCIMTPTLHVLFHPLHPLNSDLKPSPSSNEPRPFLERL